jgi:site-specific recombinase XerD
MPARINLVLPIGLEKEIRPWLDHLAAVNRSPLRILSCRDVLWKLAGYLWAEHKIDRLGDAGVLHLDAWTWWLNRQNKSASTCASAIGITKQFYGWLEKQGLIFENPAKTLVVPLVRRRLMPVLTEQQVCAILQSITGDHDLDLRDRAFLEVAYATGFRRHELVAMNLDSLDLVNRTARVLGKGQRERVVPLTHAAVDALNHYLKRARPHLLRGRQDQPALFLSERAGRRICGVGMLERTVLRANAVGIRASVHMLRRSFATHLLRGGASVAHLKDLLGHVTYKHMGHYLQYAPTELQAVHRKSPLGR